MGTDGLMAAPTQSPELLAELLAAAPSRALRRRDEMFARWAAARAEANFAYDDWCANPGSAGYAAYRAAEDRADVAQDRLAALAG